MLFQLEEAPAGAAAAAAAAAGVPEGVLPAAGLQANRHLPVQQNQQPQRQRESHQAQQWQQLSPAAALPAPRPAEQRAAAAAAAERRALTAAARGRPGAAGAVGRRFAEADAGDGFGDVDGVEDLSLPLAERLQRGRTPQQQQPGASEHGRRRRRRLTPLLGDLPDAGPGDDQPSPMLAGAGAAAWCAGQPAVAGAAAAWPAGRAAGAAPGRPGRGSEVINLLSDEDSPSPLPRRGRNPAAAAAAPAMPAAVAVAAAGAAAAAAIPAAAAAVHVPAAAGAAVVPDEDVAAMVGMGYTDKKARRVSGRGSPAGGLLQLCVRVHGAGRRGRHSSCRCRSVPLPFAAEAGSPPAGTGTAPLLPLSWDVWSPAVGPAQPEGAHRGICPTLCSHWGSVRGGRCRRDERE